MLIRVFELIAPTPVPESANTIDDDDVLAKLVAFEEKKRADDSVDRSASDGQLERVGQFFLEFELQRGELATVFRGRHFLSQRAVIVKVLHPWVEFDETLVAELRSVSKTPRVFDRRAIALILGAGRRADGRQYLVVEDLACRSLGRMLREDHRRSIFDQLNILEAIASSLEVVHDAGLVHGDLKPSNVFIRARVSLSQHATLVDFGSMWRPPKSDEGIVSALVGTPCYMSPEQVCGTALDARADLYALGVIAYELATGRRPFDGTELHAILAAQLHSKPRLLANLRTTYQHLTNDLF